MAKKVPKHKYTDDEIACLKEIYRYVQNDVLHYDGEVQKLGKREALRIQGLRYGKFVLNNNEEDKANYSFEVILNTFKYCQPTIQRALRSIEFKDETHKFNYIMCIVEGKLNDVYIRMKNAKRAKEETDEVANETVARVSAEYQKKTEEKESTAARRLKDFW